MQFKTIAVSLGLFALHASARPYCKVELKAKSPLYLNHWFPLQPATYVLPGRHGRFHTSAYTLEFDTSNDCKTIQNQKLEGVIENEVWKLFISMTDA